MRNDSILRFDKKLNDETSEAFASQILCDVRELMVDDEQDEEEEALKKRIKKREEGGGRDGGESVRVEY